MARSALRKRSALSEIAVANKITLSQDWERVRVRVDLELAAG
jgi:hypothetical protein